MKDEGAEGGRLVNALIMAVCIILHDHAEKPDLLSRDASACDLF
jgi:hypothetical protein